MPLDNPFEQDINAWLTGPTTRVTARPASPIQPLAPAEEDSLLGSLGQKALGGVGYVGSTLDKLLGGRAVRTALGLATGNSRARARDLLSVIPGSDTFGLTDAGDTLHGTDLLFEDRSPDDLSTGQQLIGAAAEAALDPATYLSFGASATTKLGSQAAKLGVLPKTTAGRIAGLAATSPEAARLAQASGQAVGDVAGKPLGGLARLSLPFTDAGVELGTGSVGRSLAEGAGAAYDAALYSKPGRYLSGLFDPSVSWAGTTSLSAEGQRAARANYAALPGAEAKVRGRFLQEGNALEGAGGLGKDEGVRLRAALEANDPSTLAPGLQPTAVGWQNDLAQMLDEGRGAGRDVGDLVDDSSSYFPRQRTPLDTMEKGGRGFGRQFEGETANQIRRGDEFRNVPGGTETINNILKDPAARPAAAARDVAAEAEYLRRTHLGMSAGDDARLADLRKLAPDTGAPEHAEWQQLENLWDKSFQYARKSQGFNERYTGEGLDFFGNHPLADMTQYRLQHEKAQLGTKSIYDAAAAAADTALGAEPGALSLRDLLTRAGLKDHVDAAGKPIGASQQLLDRLAAAGKLPAGAGADALKQLHVPADVAADVLRYTKAANKVPGAVQPFLDAFDSITNLTKAWQTAWAPAFHTRNGVTGAFMNWMMGARDARVGGPAGYAKPYLDFLKLRSGDAIEGAAKLPVFQGMQLTDQQATRQLGELMYQHQVLPEFGRSAATEAVGRAGAHATEAAGTVKLPAREPAKPFGDIVKGAIDFSEPGSANPLAVAGVNVPEILGKRAGGGTEFVKDRFAPIKAGRELGHAVDEANRGSAFLAFLSQGYEPELAAARAKAAHYDYGNLTPFERTVMRRVIPFYGWVRNNLPTMAEQLVREPGGRLAQSIRTTNALRQEDGFIPEQVSEGLAIPLGGRDEQGNQRYLSHLGLPFEDAFPIVGGPRAAGRTLERLLGEANPLIKAPLEYATNRQFYSGRNLTDLYSRTLTGNQAIDQLVSNSPLGRPTNMLSTLLDFERKGPEGVAANVLGPGRITDVNVDRAQHVQARQYVEQALAGNPNIRQFSELYVKPEDAARLSPEELQLLRLYRTLADQARARSNPAPQRPPAANFPIR